MCASDDQHKIEFRPLLPISTNNHSIHLWMISTWDCCCCCLHHCRVVQLVLMYWDELGPIFYNDKIRKSYSIRISIQTNILFIHFYFHPNLFISKSIFNTYKKWIRNRCDWTHVGVFSRNSIFCFHCDGFLMMIQNK